MNNHQGISCKVPSLYTHTHRLSHWSNTSRCLSSASLCWEKASSTGRRGQVPALVGYSLFYLSWGTQDTCSPLSSTGLKLVPFPLVGRRAKGPFSPSRKELQSKRRRLTRKFRCGVTYLSLRCVRKDGWWGYLRIWKQFCIPCYIIKNCHNFEQRKITAPPDQSYLYSQGIIWWKFSNLWGFTLNKAKAKFFFHGYLHSLPIPTFSFKCLHRHPGLLIHTRTPGSLLGLPWRGPKSSGFWSQHPFLMQRTIPHLRLCFQTI